jgi:predicted anti-sigma-YlaC factor YlaD
MRARESVSGRLDGELSELEGAWLDAHLRDCAECFAYADSVAAFTRELRAAPQERPTIAIAVTSRRRTRGFRLQSAVAAVAIFALGTGASFGLGRMLGGHPAPSVRAARGVGDNMASLRADSAEQHILAMLRQLQTGDTLSSGRVIAV